MAVEGVYGLMFMIGYGSPLVIAGSFRWIGRRWEVSEYFCFHILDTGEVDGGNIAWLRLLLD